MASPAQANTTGQSPVPAPVLQDSAIKLSGYGANITISAQGIQVQVADPSRVNIVDLNGNPFVAANGNVAPIIQIAKVGDRMPNGTVYAGISPTTNTAMFAMPADHPTELSWQDAVKLTPTLVAFTHAGSKQVTASHLQDPSKDDGGWRLPTREELDVLYKNKEAIGGFSARWYWSASEYNNYTAYDQRFGDGLKINLNKGFAEAVRFVRSLTRNAR